MNKQPEYPPPKAAKKASHCPRAPGVYCRRVECPCVVLGKPWDRAVKTPEHNFTGTADEWEAAVFRSAALFRLHRFVNGGRDQAEATTFPEAVTMAMQVLDDPTMPNARVLIYAVAASERFIAIPQARWKAYLDEWDKTHGKANTPTEQKAATVGASEGRQGLPRKRSRRRSIRDYSSGRE